MLVVLRAINSGCFCAKIWGQISTLVKKSVSAETYSNILTVILPGFLPTGSYARKLPNAEGLCCFLDVDSQTVFIAS